MNVEIVKHSNTPPIRIHQKKMPNGVVRIYLCDANDGLDCQPPDCTCKGVDLKATRDDSQSGERYHIIA